jgi:hypothetical protein
MNSNDEDLDVIEELAEEVGERVKELSERVHPIRIALAGVMMLILLGALASTWYWVIPRDSVEVETVYLQRQGHIIMNEFSNTGSREITDVILSVEVLDSSDVIVGQYQLSFASVSSHTSISGDEMELVLFGHSVWEEYRVIINVDWTDFDGKSHTQTFSHPIGETMYEIFTDECDTTTWFL